jgi:predicted RND superfamily exporter protein
MSPRRLLTLGLDHRILTSLFLALVTAACALGLPRLQTGTDFSRLIADSDPDKQIYRLVAREFGSDNRTLVYAADDDLWSTEKLKALEELHRTLERLPFTERVESLYSLRSIRGHQGRIDSRLLLSEAPADAAAAEKAREDALYNPLVTGNFLSRGGNITALMVSVRPQPDNPRFEEEVHGELEAALAPFKGRFQTLFQIGPPRINTELNHALQEDMRLLGPVSAGVLVITILVFLRSGVGALLPLITSGLSIVWTFGLMGWLGIPLTVLSAMLPSLIIAIGSTEDTHMMAAYLQALNEGGEPPRLHATRRMLRRMGLPMFLTVGTTALGFAGNILNPIGLIREFAMVSTFAIIANGLITWLLVPIGLSLIGPRHSRLANLDEPTGGLTGLLVRLFGLTRQHFPRGILILTTALCAFFLYHAAQLHVTNDPLSYFKQERELIHQVNQAQADLAGLKVFFITLESDDLKAFLKPENLEKLQRIQEFIAQQKAFDRSISLADHLALVNREFHDGNPRYHRIPASRELVAQYLLFFHRNDIAPYVSSDFSRANIIVRHGISDSRTLNRYIDELKEAVRHIAGSGFKTHVVGENLMINAAADRLLLGQVQSLAVLLLLIFLIMSVMFTSFKGGIIAMVPGVIPIILMFGVMGLLDIPLNPGTAMVAVIAVGIAVDGTIHLLSRYNELCRRTSDYDRAVQDTVNQEALPAIATSLALALGFGLLMLSQFSVIAQFGALSAATMLFSIFANLLITPIIMTRIRLVGLYEILAMSVHNRVIEHSPLFQGMNRYEMRKSIVISELNEFEEGELLIKQGSRSRSMYLILEGRVEVSVQDQDGKRRHIAELHEGDVFGEIGFIKAIRRTADVRALTPVQALRYDFESIRKNLRFFPGIVAKLNFNISGILGDRLARTIEEQHGGPSR